MGGEQPGPAASRHLACHCLSPSSSSLLPALGCVRQSFSLPPTPRLLSFSCFILAKVLALWPCLGRRLDPTRSQAPGIRPWGTPAQSVLEVWGWPVKELTSCLAHPGRKEEDRKRNRSGGWQMGRDQGGEGGGHPRRLKTGPPHPRRGAAGLPQDLAGVADLWGCFHQTRIGLSPWDQCK